MEAASIVQTCYVVPRLEEACERFHAAFGIGPFVGGSEAELGSHVYRGVPAPPIRLRGVFVQAGPITIELLQILSDGPSAFADMFDRNTSGLHHVALFCEDYEATKAGWVARGCPVASEFSMSFGARICYVDARAELGHMVELYPQHAIIRDLFRQAADAVPLWDRRSLIVPWS